MLDTTSLKQYLMQCERDGKGIDLEFIALIDDIAGACREIHLGVNHGAILGVLGSAGSENVQGETQKKLDVLSNDYFIKHCQWGGQLAGMASEEEDDVYEIPAKYPRGKYLMYFDPLDGSSNIDVNITVGSIFSIVKAPEGVTDPKLPDYLIKGTEQVCGGFCLYGPSTMMVITIGDGVHGFTLHPGTGEFLLTNPNMKIPEDTKEFAVNMSNHRFWEEPVQRYVDECLKGTSGTREKDFNMRWVASMVAEVYRILTRGGIFMYPKDNKDPNKPGKLRLMYEANPMSYIVEQAGGLSTTGRERILEVQPDDIHQRVPVILGSKNEVQRVIDYHK
ncbi:MAG: class 1 fructose-bisphosphatase [Gammaproteobacteria bacterium]|nr:class 1 fructose-bisphosphatase [Gammaproteobacteria bacterium]MDH5728639.1 class 1 fructose-bisphosphatase [Gammaproteobacteria bacterium]